MAIKYLISKNKKQYKANLHCHSTLSDGKLTPEKLKEVYKARGYNILAITDHCYPKCHDCLTDDDFLMITGYEAYIRPSAKAEFNRFKPEVHLNLFAKDSKNEKIICYNKPYIKYMPAKLHNSLPHAGSEREREYTAEYVNEFIDTANRNGYLVAYNHPIWSMEDEARILSYKNIFSLELYNTGSYIGNNLENGEVLYDNMLRCGMRIGCHAGDDNHNSHPFDSPYSDSFGWYTVIMADKLDYKSVINALEEKNCYASNGPAVYELVVKDGKFGHIECSDASSIFVFYGSLKNTAKIRMPKGEVCNSFDFSIPNEAEFIRITIYDKDGNVANTRGFFRDEWSE